MSAVGTTSVDRLKSHGANTVVGARVLEGSAGRQHIYQFQTLRPSAVGSTSADDVLHRVVL